MLDGPDAVPSVADPAADPAAELVRSYARRLGHQVDATLPMAAVWALLVDGGDPAPGLSFATWATPAGTGGPLLPLLANSPDLATLLDQLARFHPLFGNDRLALRSTRSQTVLELRSADGGPALPDTVDACFGLLCRVIGQLTRPARHPTRVRLRRTGSPRPERHREYFAEVVFGADRDSCAFDPIALATPIAGADPTLLRLVRPYAERRLVERGERWSALVGRTLRELIEGRESIGPAPTVLPTVHEVSRRLAVSSRSLQQYLSAEQVTFSGLLDTMQRDRALAMLLAGDEQLTVIAHRLGFSTSAALGRAVRRWTGLSPSRYRSRAYPARDGR